MTAPAPLLCSSEYAITEIGRLVIADGPSCLVLIGGPKSGKSDVLRRAMTAFPSGFMSVCGDWGAPKDLALFVETKMASNTTTRLYVADQPSKSRYAGTPNWLADVWAAAERVGATLVIAEETLDQAQDALALPANVVYLQLA